MKFNYDLKYPKCASCKYLRKFANHSDWLNGKDPTQYCCVALMKQIDTDTDDEGEDTFVFEVKPNEECPMFSISTRRKWRPATKKRGKKNAENS